MEADRIAEAVQKTWRLGEYKYSLTAKHPWRELKCYGGRVGGDESNVGRVRVAEGAR